VLSIRKSNYFFISTSLNHKCMGLSCRSQWTDCSSILAEIWNSDMYLGKEACSWWCCRYWGDCTRFQVLTSFISAQSPTTTYYLGFGTSGAHACFSKFYTDGQFWLQYC